MSEPTVLAPGGDPPKRRIDPIGFFHDHPFLSLGIAAGLGYVIGGGLFTPFTVRMIKIGARAVVMPTVKSQLDNFRTE